MQVPSPSSRVRDKIYVSSWDLFWAISSPPLALFSRDGMAVFQLDWAAAAYYCVFASGLALVSFFALRIQDGMLRSFSVQEFLYIAEAVLFTELMTCGVLFSLTRLDGIPRSVPLIHAVLLGAGLVAGRLFFRVVLQDSADDTYHSRHERIIIVGASRFAAHFIQMLRAYAPPGQPVIAILDNDPKMIGRAVAGIQVLGMPHELDAVITEFAIHGIHTDRVIIAGEVDYLGESASQELAEICHKHQVEIQYLPRLIGITRWNVQTVTPAAPADGDPLPALPAYFWLKRWIDVLGTTVLILLLSPIALLTGFLVLLDVGAPVLFWQERLGWRGRPFLIYKFRTLRAPFDSDAAQSDLNGRSSAIGRFLRATRLDELPQLLNVLLGDMSLIGPRPLLPEDQPANLRTRLSVRPGLTGWAQVNGGKLVTKEEKEKFDDWYVRNASLLVDTRIAFLTLKILMGHRYAEKEAEADAAQVKQKSLGVIAAADRKASP